MNQRSLYHFLLVLILLTGFFLRFWDFWNIPFTFDELSAMGRTTYDSFSDLIRYGVVERDSHPAGIQVFLYYWTKLFGDSEMVVKLPFLMAGMASIWLAYKIGNLWFGNSAGILTAAYVSSLQLFVMYSQMARPYSSGLFFTLMMVWFWSKYFLESNKIRNLFWFVIFAALSAYNHYFSLLFAATVGLTGLILVNRKNVWPYVLSGMAVVILYIPHLQIFLAQAAKGSIGGWLGMPSIWFPVQFLDWLFHYSYWSYGLIVLILVFGIILGKKTINSGKTKKRFILFLWLLPAPLFGYIYSVTVEPILQFSLIIFSAPYLFILFFSFIGDLDFRKLGIVVTLILIVNVTTLIYGRNYYQIFYKQPFEEVVKKAIELEGQYPNEVFIINYYIPYYSEYYFRKYNKYIPYYTVRNQELSIAQFDSVVKQINENIVITSGLKPGYFQVVKDHFPFWTGYDYGFTFEQYTFSKTSLRDEQELRSELIAFTDFQETTGNWNYSNDQLTNDSVNQNQIYLMSPEHQWGPLAAFPLGSIADKKYFFVDISVDIKPNNNQCRGVLVAEIKKGEETVAWYGMDFEKYDPEKGMWKKIFMTVRIQDALVNVDLEGCIFRTFIWNPNKSDFSIRSYKISSRPGNPIRYSLFHEVEEQ